MAPFLVRTSGPTDSTRPKARALGFSFVTLLVAGCVSYEPAPVDVSQVLHDLEALRWEASGTNGDETSAEDGATPRELAAFAVAHNPTLSAVRGRIGVSNALLIEAGLLPDPTIGWDAMDVLAVELNGEDFEAVVSSVDADASEIVVNGDITVFVQPGADLFDLTDDEQTDLDLGDLEEDDSVRLFGLDGCEAETFAAFVVLLLPDELPEPEDGEGCGVGFWKNHLDAWPEDIDPDDLFSDYFDDAFPGKTLLDVLRQGGGELHRAGVVHRLAVRQPRQLHPPAALGLTAQEQAALGLGELLLAVEPEAGLVVLERGVGHGGQMTGSMPRSAKPLSSKFLRKRSRSFSAWAS